MWRTPALFTGTFPSVMSEIMERTLAKLSRWAQECGLRLNPKKTELMLFTRKYKPPTFRIPTIDGEQLTLTTSTNYLGLQIDHKFNWKMCTEECVKKAWGAFYVCREMMGKNWGLRPSMVLWMYQAVVRPVLMYGSVVL